MKVLFVEDDKKIISFVKKGLKEQGFVVPIPAKTARRLCPGRRAGL